MLKSLLALCVVLLDTTCGTQITLIETRPAGLVDVRPFDAAGECVMGLRTEFSLPDGSTTHGNNAYDCYFTTSGPPGTWALTLTAPEGYGFAPGQENPVSVRPGTARRRALS